MQLQTINLAYTRGDTDLFSGLNIKLSAGDALRVSGANGAGKTSLLRLLCGLAFPSEGEVRWNNLKIQAQREEYGRALVYLGHAPSIKDDLLAWENLVVTASLQGHHISKADAYQALNAMGLQHAADLPSRVLSQGQKKRVALARLQLNFPSQIWILDEAFTALDQASVKLLCTCLEEHLQKGGMLIYTTHQEIQLKAGQQHTLDLHQRLLC